MQRRSFEKNPEVLSALPQFPLKNFLVREGTSPVPVVGGENNGIVSNDDETTLNDHNAEIEVVAESARLREAQRRRRADDRHSERRATVDFHDLHDRRQRAIRFVRLLFVMGHPCSDS
jgi:hypothetical protein